MASCLRNTVREGVVGRQPFHGNRAVSQPEGYRSLLVTKTGANFVSLTPKIKIGFVLRYFKNKDNCNGM